jgi:Methylamine utilisation protein MauE
VEFASVALAARLVVAAAFLGAALQKLRFRNQLVGELAGFGVPATFVAPTAVALPVVELVTAGALVVFASSSVPAFVAVALLALFTGAVFANLAQGRHPPCPCFGASSSAPVSSRTVLRNGWLLALAVLATASIDGARAGGVLLWTAALGAATAVLLTRL